MPRHCTVCGHPNVEEINKALLEGASYRDIAQRFAVSKDALFRHRQHLPAQLVAAHQAQEAIKAGNLLEQLNDLQRRTLAILEAAESGSDYGMALKAIKEARENLKLLAEIGQARELEERLEQLEAIVRKGGTPNDAAV
ncbi:MAG: hypothetical protein H5U02_11635 [Clostridia bacterium]|nr:hypothetical protein [Clostridia bacterium]